MAWRNWKKSSGLNPEEKEFVWKVQQDMLAIGARFHRPNADKRCKIELDGDEICQEVQTRKHLFIECESVRGIFVDVKRS